MGKVVCLLVCLAVCIGTGYALRCYTCGECKGESPAKVESECAKATDGFTQYCFHKIELDKKTSKVNATYSCEIANKDAKLDKDSLSTCKPTSANFEVKECGGCTTNLCNSAPVLSRNLISFWWLPLMYCSVKVLWQ